MTSRLGIKARFTLLYGTAMTLMVILVSCGIYFFVRQALLNQIENHLRKDGASIREFIKHDRDGLSQLAEHGPIHLFRVQRDNHIVATSQEWKSLQLDSLLGHKRISTNPEVVITDDGRHYLLQSFNMDVGNQVFTIIVGHNKGSIQQTLRTLAQIILLIMPIAIAISLAFGYMIAGRVLAPISAITRKAEEISAENLSERLPTGVADDEFNRLATVFNQTFARIEDSFVRLKRFTADASHELRTPLAAIRSIGETALQAPAGQLNCRETIGNILEESDRLRQLIEALLLLSRTDAGEIDLQREAVDLASLARETVEFLIVLAEEKHQSIQLNVEAEAVVMVDRSSIRQALTNLLDNAIKYSPPESSIIITVGISNRSEAFVEIADSGSGIPEEDIQHIFDRFYRIDKGRSREMGGAGLGLSIVKWAMEINCGKIEVRSELNRGSNFRAIFPMSEQKQ